MGVSFDVRVAGVSSDFVLFWDGGIEKQGEISCIFVGTDFASVQAVAGCEPESGPTGRMQKRSAGA
jgi:hypothetical protein